MQDYYPPIHEENNQLYEQETDSIPEQSAEQPEEMTEQERLEQVESLYRKREWNNQKMKVLFIFMLIILAFAAILLRWGLFKVKDIAVIGLNEVPYTEMVNTLSRVGLTKGCNMPSINRDAVEKAVNANYHFIFEDLLLDYRKQTAIVVVRERKSLAVVEVLGTLYTVSDDGYVMDVYSGNGLQMPKATGLNVQSARPGRKLLNVNDALYSLRVVLYELEMQKILNRITEISLSDLTNIRLYTQEGRTIILGDSTQLMKKIVAMRTAENLVWRINASGGETINVSNPEAVTVQYPQV